MLSVNNVTKNYGSFTALKDINLEFKSGVYALLAPNGAGKTTLIKMLTTLIFPSSGEILYDGTEITSLDDEYRNLLGYLPQDFGYYKNYSPNKFLLYLAALKGIDSKSELSKDKIVIMSTHIVSDIEFIANEVIMIKDHEVLFNDTVKNICNRIYGKVYEAEIDFKDSRDFAKDHVMLSERQEDGRMVIRFVSEGDKNESWKEVVPNLEDVFLYEYNDNL